MSEQFERDLFLYGVPENGVTMSRKVAEKAAQNQIGKLWGNGRVVSTRLEDTSVDGSQGRVIAVMEPVQKWTPGPSEVK